jgi:hypothetical protein
MPGLPQCAEPFPSLFYDYSVLDHFRNQVDAEPVRQLLMIRDVENDDVGSFSGLDASDSVASVQGISSIDGSRLIASAGVIFSWRQARAIIICIENVGQLPGLQWVARAMGTPASMSFLAGAYLLVIKWKGTPGRSTPRVFFSAML